jgi:acyl carrier protein
MVSQPLNELIRSMLDEELRLGQRVREIDDDAPLFGDGLGLDSLDALQLAVGVEKRFGVSISDREEGRRAFQSINTLAAYLREKGFAG